MEAFMHDSHLPLAQVLQSGVHFLNKFKIIIIIKEILREALTENEISSVVEAHAPQILLVKVVLTLTTE